MAVFETSRASGAPAPVELDGVKVLLIVRDAAAVDRVGRLLRASGAVLLPAFSAQDALTRLRVERPDVIACELDLPDCHGLHLMRRVRMRARAEGGATPAIALSGAFSPEAHTRAMLVGYQGVVPLACNALELSLAILEAIGGRKRRRPN